MLTGCSDCIMYEACCPEEIEDEKNLKCYRENFDDFEYMMDLDGEFIWPEMSFRVMYDKWNVELTEWDLFVLNG